MQRARYKKVAIVKTDCEKTVKQLRARLEFLAQQVSLQRSEPTFKQEYMQPLEPPKKDNLYTDIIRHQLSLWKRLLSTKLKGN